MDVAGDHALCCAHNGLYRRHNHIRGALFHLAQSANWSPVLEKQLPNSLDRPADLLLQNLDSRPTAVDVTVVHPLRPSASVAVRAQRDSAAADAEAQKIARNRVVCEGAGWNFMPFGLEVTGGLGPAAKKLCRRLTQQLAMRAGQDVAACAENVGVWLSLALAKGRGEMLSAATPLTTTS